MRERTRQQGQHSERSTLSRQQRSRPWAKSRFEVIFESEVKGGGDFSLKRWPKLYVLPEQTCRRRMGIVCGQCRADWAAVKYSLWRGNKKKWTRPLYTVEVHAGRLTHEKEERKELTVDRYLDWAIETNEKILKIIFLWYDNIYIHPDMNECYFRMQISDELLVFRSAYFRGYTHLYLSIKWLWEWNVRKFCKLI